MTHQLMKTTFNVQSIPLVLKSNYNLSVQAKLVIQIQYTSISKELLNIARSS